MLTDIFLQILNMSFTGSIVILILLLARVFLKKVPRTYLYVLWSVAFFRLLCPFSIESALSLLPVNPQPVTQQILYSQAPQIETGLPPLDAVVNQSLPAPQEVASVNPLQVYAFIGSWLWVFGVFAAVGWSLLSFVRLYLRLRKDRDWQPDGFYQVKGLETPFVLGEKEQAYILLHEKHHIRRFDPLAKLIAFLAVCLHWFNPLVWAAFFFCGRDMEMSCDEAVIRKLGNGVKKEYAASLLTLSTGRRYRGGIPLAFGEGDTKGRIKNVLHYRRPAFWAATVGLAAAVIVLVGLAVNPRRSPYALSNEEIAENFSQIWLDNWSTLSAERMTNGHGRAFLMDVNGDNAEELFFLCDNYRTTLVTIFDISGRDIKELGSFEGDSFYASENPGYDFYRGKSGGVLIHASVTAAGPAANPAEAVTEHFVVCQNKALHELEPLYRVKSGNGNTLYYSSPYGGEEVSLEEYLQLRTDIIGDYIPECRITLLNDYPYVEFEDAGKLKQYILNLLNQGNCPATGVMVSSVETETEYRREVYVMTTDNAPFGCDTGRADGFTDAEIMDLLDSLNGFVFDRSQTVLEPVTLRLTFPEEQPQSVTLTGLENGERKSYPVLSDGYRFTVPEQSGYYCFATEVTWPGQTKETVCFSVSVCDVYEGIARSVTKTEGGYLLELEPWQEDPSPGYASLSVLVPDGVTVSAMGESWSMEQLAEKENILLAVYVLPESGNGMAKAARLQMLVG